MDKWEAIHECDNEETGEHECYYIEFENNSYYIELNPDRYWYCIFKDDNINKFFKRFKKSSSCFKWFENEKNNLSYFKSQSKFNYMAKLW